MASKQQADQEFDPKYEWQENAANFLLRVHLSGFRKEDFRVQVDGAGRLTVRGQRADGGKHVRFHKVFQLPPTSSLDDISGRFDAGVLALTVPKRPAPPPATIDDIRKPAKQADEAKPKEEKAETKTTTPHVQGKEETKKAEQHKEAETKKPKEDARKKAVDEKIKEELEAKKKAVADEQIKAQVEAKKKAAADEQIKAEVEAKRSKPEHEHKTTVRKEEGKAKAEGPTETKVVDRESILERARRRAEEERAKAAAAEEAECQRKQSACGGWKERVTEELQGLTKSEWAEGVVETVKKNKEVIAAAAAAFSLGLFVSSRLFSRN